VPSPDALGPRQTVEAQREVEDLHKPFQKMLEARRIAYIYSRPDKPTGQRVGLPDFCFAVAGIPVAIEFKLPGKKPRKSQHNCIADMEANGWRCLVATDLRTAWQFVLHLQDNDNDTTT